MAKTNGRLAKAEAKLVGDTLVANHKKVGGGHTKRKEVVVDGDEARVKYLQALIEEVDQDEHYMLIYDIEQAKERDVDNPSGVLWSLGFRMQYSCWCCPSRSFEHPAMIELLELWDEHNVEYHLVPYAERANAQLRALARARLDKELVRIHTSFIQRIAAASERFEEARQALGKKAEAEEFEAVEDSWERNVRVVFKESKAAFEAALSCANLFDEEGNLDHLFRGLRKAMEAEAKAFNVHVESKKRKPVSTP